MNREPTSGASDQRVDWAALFFDAANDFPGKFMARARRRYGESPDAEAAYNFALDKISADDWAPLREHYAQRGSPAGFLAITFFNFLEEYARHKYPRVRPPSWLKRLGDVWVRTWQMLCLQRQSAETIVDALGHTATTPRGEIRHAVAEIKRRVPNCGQYVAEQTADDETLLRHAEADGDAPEDASAQDIALALLQVLGGLLDQAGGGEASLDEAGQRAALAALGRQAELTDQERLLLKLVYEEGHKIASAARALDVPRKQASRMHLSILARLREALAPLGLESS